MPVLPYRQAHPTLGDRVLIAPNAYVIGDVVIGADTSVWFGTVIRGDVFPIKIGSRSNIQDNSVVHVTTDKYSATIGDDVTVGHRVILHGCTVEDGALIGMGAIVMDRAHIGRGALVAAGTLVPEGMQVPPGMVAMGSPAKIIRPVSDAQREYLAYAAPHYVEVAAEYAKAIGWGR